jgi:hypothetical protein
VMKPASLPRLRALISRVVSKRRADSVASAL